MSIELNRQEIGITEDKCNAEIKAITESDIIVPDSKSDCLRILEVDAMPVLSEKYISKDYITLTGNLSYKILYLGEDNRIENIEYNAPFSKQIDAAGCDETMTGFIRCCVSHVEHSVINSRKLNVKSVMNVEAKAYSKNDVPLISSINSDLSLPCKTKSVNNFNMSICSEHDFSVEEAVKLPPAGPDIDSILKYDVRITDQELKVVINKVVARGNLLLSTLYVNEGEIYSAENEIPFTHIADVDGITPDMYTTADYEIKSISCERNMDDDATMSVINLKADVGLTLRSYDEKKVEYISDVYSPDYDIAVEKQQISVTEMIDATSTQCTVSESFVSGADIERIYSVTSKSFVDEVILNQNSVTVNGFVNAVVLCKSSGETSGIQSVSGDIPFSCTLPVTRNYSLKDTFAEADTLVEHESYSIEGGSNIKLRLIVRVNTAVKRKFDIDAVTDITFDETKKIDKSSQSGITIYFVQNGDDMWSIAKRYHTTSSEINSVNNLDENATLSLGQQLLIPKRSE